MRDGMTIRTKLLIVGVGMSVVPVLVASVIVRGQVHRRGAEGQPASRARLDQELSQAVRLVQGLCASADERLTERVDSGMNLARDVLDDTLPLTVTDRMRDWAAVNEDTGEIREARLAVLQAGAVALTEDAGRRGPLPVVDAVAELTGVTCTLFQRMNDEGDMLRVCTTLRRADGTRAAGTYIPAEGRDGRVVRALLAGRSYRGPIRAFGRWYQTMYEPIFDGDKRVIGALAVAAEREYGPTLTRALAELRIGKTGGVTLVEAGSRGRDSRGGVTRVAVFAPWETMIVARGYEGEFLVTGGGDRPSATRGGAGAMIVLTGVTFLSAVVVWLAVAKMVYSRVRELLLRQRQAIMDAMSPPASVADDGPVDPIPSKAAAFPRRGTAGVRVPRAVRAYD